MIIWQGKGIIIALLAVGGLLLSQLGTEASFGTGYYQAHGWPKLLGLSIAAFAVYALRTWLGQASLFFIPARFWSAILGVLGIVALLPLPPIDFDLARRAAGKISGQTDIPSSARADAQYDWMNSLQYQEVFNRRNQEGFYPHQVEGRCQNNHEEFRAVWNTLPAGTSFWSHHGITKERYDTFNQHYVAEGYSLLSVQTFQNCSGAVRYQATWLKKQR